MPLLVRFTIKPMQPSRRLFAAVLAVLALSAAPLVGCSSAKTFEPPLPDATTLLKESSATTRNLNSAHLDIKVNGSILNLPVHTLTGDLTNTPAVAAKGNANITLRGQRLDAEFVLADTHLFVALTPVTEYHVRFSPGKWSDVGPAADIYDLPVILDPSRGLANILANFSDPKADGRETVNGVQTVRVKGTISAEAISAIVPDFPTPVPGTAWIRQDGNHDLVKLSAGNEDNSMELTLSHWNKPVTVTKPIV
jgi:lipoprotein LprG